MSEIQKCVYESQSVQQFWSEAEARDPKSYYVSDYGGKGMWESLNILNLIKSGCRVLEIGVGNGGDIRELNKIGAAVYALDICPDALFKVAKTIKQGWTTTEVSSLPKDFFDVVISHLVAQHMSNADLQEQIKNILPTLKSDGVFAMQYADRLKDHNYDESVETQKGGGVCRSFEMISDMVDNANGTITWHAKIAESEIHQSCWHAINIKRK